MLPNLLPNLSPNPFSPNLLFHLTILFQINCLLFSFVYYSLKGQGVTGGHKTLTESYIPVYISEK
jgi:hypothetical protein